jgi:hypothetical protein
VLNPESRSNANKDQQRNIGCDSACILQPLSYVEPDDVEQHRHAQQHERAGEQKCSVLRE